MTILTGKEGGGWDWRCYALEEGLAEKLRAVLGQRRYAIARDLYDIHTLSEKSLDLQAVKEALPEKVDARDIDADGISADTRHVGRAATCSAAVVRPGRREVGVGGHNFGFRLLPIVRVVV